MFLMQQMWGNKGHIQMYYYFFITLLNPETFFIHKKKSFMDVFNEARSAKPATNNSVAVLLIFFWLWLKPGPLTQQKRR